MMKYLSFISVMFILLLWGVVTSFALIDQTLLAGPVETFRVIIAGDQIFIHAWHTIIRALEGWSVALVLGGFIGLAIGMAGNFFKAIEPLMEFLRAIPPVMAFPLFLVGFNYGEGAYIWTVIFGCFPIMMLTVSRGFQQISKDKLELLALYHVKKRLRLMSCFMESLPHIFLGGRLTLSFALVIAVVTEMIFTPRSGFALGALARDAEINFDTPTFYAAVLVIGGFGYFANVALRKIHQKFFI